MFFFGLHSNSPRATLRIRNAAEHETATCIAPLVPHAYIYVYVVHTAYSGGWLLWWTLTLNCVCRVQPKKAACAIKKEVVAAASACCTIACVCLGGVMWW